MVFENIHPQDSEEYFWINTDWLSEWIKGQATPNSVIQHKEFLCKHDKLDPQKVNKVKRISKKAWEQFRKNFECDLEISSTGEYFPCEECVKAICLGNEFIFN